MQRPGNKLFGFIKEKESHFSGTRALQYYPGFQVCWGYGCALSSPSVWDLPQLMTNLDTNISPVVTFFPLITHSSNVYWATASVLWLAREGQPSLVAFVLFSCVIDAWGVGRCLGLSFSWALAGWRGDQSTWSSLAGHDCCISPWLQWWTCCINETGICPQLQTQMISSGVKISGRLNETLKENVKNLQFSCEDFSYERDINSVGKKITE